jgi:hypothetical protein
MKLGIWPFGNKSNENSVKEFVVIKNMPLEQVSCDVLKEEIARRKKENHDMRVRKANAKADKVDKLIDELCNEIMPVDGKNSSDLPYPETLMFELKEGILSIFETYSGYNYHHNGRREAEERICNFIYDAVYHVDNNAIHIASIFKYMKAEYRKTLLANIKEEC